MSALQLMQIGVHILFLTVNTCSQLVILSFDKLKIIKRMTIHVVLSAIEYVPLIFFSYIFTFLCVCLLVCVCFHRSQEVFRQAMRSPTVRLEVVPVGNRERYERSLIGPLFTSTPDGTPTHATGDGPPRTKDPPPPVKVKPTLRPLPAEARDPSTGGAGGGAGGGLEVRVTSSSPHPPSSRLSPSPSPSPKGRSESPLLRKGLGHSPLASLTSKKGGKRIRIDLKKGESNCEHFTANSLAKLGRTFNVQARHNWSSLRDIFLTESQEPQI